LLAHILRAAVRALAASILLGTVLIYAVGGLDSPLARPLVGVIAIGFFVFWIVFAFLFGRLPAPERRGTQAETEGGSMSWARGSRRDHGERGERDGEAGGGDGGD
jgi:ABC-type dipeptide/oligopeptide/nickel transport system permease subunit